MATSYLSFYQNAQGTNIQFCTIYIPFFFFLLAPDVQSVFAPTNPGGA